MASNNPIAACDAQAAFYATRDKICKYVDIASILVLLLLFQLVRRIFRHMPGTVRIYIVFLYVLTQLFKHLLRTTSTCDFIPFLGRIVYA